MTDHDLDVELVDDDAGDTTGSGGGPVPGGWAASGPLAGFLDGMPLAKVAAVAAAGLVLGFLGGRVSAPESMVAVPMAAQVVSPTAPATAPAIGPRTDTTERPEPYDAGTTYPAPPSAAGAATGGPSGLATGDPGKAKPGSAVTSDPLLAGYSTRIPPFYIKQRCLRVDETENVPPELCLRKWELLSPTVQDLWRKGIPI